MACLVLAIGTLSVVQANGIGKVWVQDRAVGPYLLTLSTQPARLTPGVVHVSLLLRDPATGQDLRDATVTLWAQPPEPEEGRGPYPVPSTTATPAYYDVNVDLDRTGEWNLRFSVEGPLGSGHITVTLEVVEPGINWTAISAVATGLLILVLLGWAYRTRNTDTFERRPDS